MAVPEKKRKLSGTNVYIVGNADGSQVLGKMRLVDARGAEVTDPLTRGIKATLQKQDQVTVGKVILVDSDGNDIGALIRVYLESLSK